MVVEHETSIIIHISTVVCNHADICAEYYEV